MQSKSMILMAQKYKDELLKAVVLHEPIEIKDGEKKYVFATNSKAKELILFSQGKKKKIKNKKKITIP